MCVFVHPVDGRPSSPLSRSERTEGGTPVKAAPVVPPKKSSLLAGGSPVVDPELGAGTIKAINGKQVIATFAGEDYETDIERVQLKA